MKDTRGTDRPLVVAQVGLLADPLRRGPEELLRAWPTLSDIAEAATGAGAEVTVIQAAHHAASLERGGVRYRFVRAPTPSRIRRRLGLWATPLTPDLVRSVRLERPDVVHVHGLGFPRHVRALARALPTVPVLMQDHADGVPGPLGRALHRLGWSAAAAVSFTSAEMAEPFRAAGVFPPHARVFSIPESSSRFTPGDREAARAATGLGGDPCLLWVGHLNRNKDPLTALEGVRWAASRLPGYRLWCVYRDAPLLPQVQARIQADPLLRDRVHLLGPQPPDRVELLMRAADFLISASHREGSGYAVLEAMACGTPPVVTDIPAFKALTDGGTIGWLFPVGNPEALGRALVEAYRTDGLQRRTAVVRHFHERLSFAAVGNLLVDAYRYLLGREGAVRTSSVLSPVDSVSGAPP